MEVARAVDPVAAGTAGASTSVQTSVQQVDLRFRRTLHRSAMSELRALWLPSRMSPEVILVRWKDVTNIGAPVALVASSFGQ
jgi:hypothetical protein